MPGAGPLGHGVAQRQPDQFERGRLAAVDMPGAARAPASTPHQRSERRDARARPRAGQFARPAGAAFCLLPFALPLAPCSLLFALHSLPRHPQLAFATRPCTCTCTCTCTCNLQPATCNLQPATCNLQAIQYFSLRGNRLRRPLLNSPLNQANRQR
ncbi:hypothetical protein X947_4302 [Burkholderia pseudomallei MSHR7334]|nr:hypothetical protein X947_4302 [Burkholderia pseudomallei MSHR7334]